MDVFLGKFSQVRRLRLGHCWSTGVVVIPLSDLVVSSLSKLEMWTCPNLGALEVVILKDLASGFWSLELQKCWTNYTYSQVHQVYILLSYIGYIVSPDVGFKPKCASGFSFRWRIWSKRYFPPGKIQPDMLENPHSWIIFAKKPWNKSPPSTPFFLRCTPWEGDKKREILDVFPIWFSFCGFL